MLHAMSSMPKKTKPAPTNCGGDRSSKKFGKHANGKVGSCECEAFGSIVLECENENGTMLREAIQEMDMFCLLLFTSFGVVRRDVGRGLPVLAPLTVFKMWPAATDFWTTAHATDQTTVLLFLKSRLVSASLKRGMVAEIAGTTARLSLCHMPRRCFGNFCSVLLVRTGTLMSTLILHFSTLSSKKQLPSALKERAKTLNEGLDL